MDDRIYTIYARRNKSQFNEVKQKMKCRVLEVHRNYMLVDSLNRHGAEYNGASRVESGQYAGMAVRRINKEQALVIEDASTGRWVEWETVRRRHARSS